MTLPNGYPFDAGRAVALFRFHRQQQALQELDAARAVVRGPWRWRMPPDARKDVWSRLDALRRCLATTTPPALATLTVRVIGHSPDDADELPQGGARVYVEGVPVGRTSDDGTLTVHVPSGPVRVEADIPIDQWGEMAVNLAPGASNAIELALADGKEVTEQTTLALAEAVDDMLPITARSLTLTFRRDGLAVPISSVDEIEVVGREGNVEVPLTQAFHVVGGKIVAIDAARVLASLSPHLDDAIVLRVSAEDVEKRMHYGQIAFRVAQWPLSVNLEAPPSNPRLAVSDIEVGISLAGGFAVQRVSDASGRFEIASLPSGPVTFECVARSGRDFYYCDATLDHAGPASVTLVLRGVTDIVNGVRPLRIKFQDIPVRRSR